MELTSTNIIELKKQSESFLMLMLQYECVINNIKNRLEVLNKEYTILHGKKVFHNIVSRLKTHESIAAKLEKNNHNFTVVDIEEHLSDVAGVRVICSFKSDIYTIAKYLCDQDDIKVLKMKDYISNPKDNGYRSFHLVLSVPVFLTNQKKYVKVEVQFRTIAMDFWASLEHQIKYKHDIEDYLDITKKLKIVADTISDTDDQLNELKNRIDSK